MDEINTTREQMLEVCTSVPGWTRADECVWLFETAAQVPAGGTWVEFGLWKGRSFLAAGLGLSPGCRLWAVDRSWRTNEQVPLAGSPDEESARNVARLRELRPDLRIQVLASDAAKAADRFDDGSIEVVFNEACYDYETLTAQIRAWRPKITDSGRLAGHGYACPGADVTRAVVESLPGASSGAGTIWTWSPLPPLDTSSPLPRLSVIVSTTGRASLPATLASIRSQRLIEGDEILLVHDGEAKINSVIAWDQAGLPGKMIVLAGGPHRDWGAAARTRGQSMATGSHLLWQDDDDAYLPGAFDVIRREIVATPDDMLLFRLAYPGGRVLWSDRTIRCKNVSTQMYVIPRTAQLGRWGSRYTGDFDFIQSTVDANPGRPIRFVDKPIVMYSR